ncbi:hypothetical protein MTR_7g070647 [Medicago truncatula]|uniref:Uncharacterized protein n=1 Tax=Medicago truncatula TaxID=3880 RepID=A0A072U219_MEDTR|nr:hypothetical protein MTR_7g070647 [Medicago truncatula]
MYVIRLETTLYICGTGHLKIVTLGYNYQQSWRILKKENNRRGEKREENSKNEDDEDEKSDLDVVQEKEDDNDDLDVVFDGFDLC